MRSKRKIVTDLKSVKRVRRGGGPWSVQCPLLGKLLLGVAGVCVIGVIVVAIIIPVRFGTKNVDSEGTEVIASSSTTSIAASGPTTSITANGSTTTVVASNTNANTTAVATSATTTVPIVLSYRGVYIDGFNSILGNAAAENLTLSWCVKNNFNTISLYDLNTIMGTSSRWTSLAQFIKKARVTYGISQVTAVRGSSNNFVQNDAYDSGRTDPYERFTGYNLELEWWNTGSNFSLYTPVLSTMVTIAKNETPPMTTETYIGYFNNPTGQELTQANTLVSALDRILVHDYQTSPSLGYMLNRIPYLGQAANSQNRTVNVIAIFSAEPSFMYNYFDVNGQNHIFSDAYQVILNQFNATNFTYNANVQFIGYQIYAYSYAVAARPL